MPNAYRHHLMLSQDVCLLLIDSESPATKKKMTQESTYPPPADGVCVLFLCKPGCSANEPAAQAGRGALRVIGSFTDCKFLKRSAVRLHNGAAGDHKRGRAGGRGFIGPKILKHSNQAIFR